MHNTKITCPLFVNVGFGTITANSIGTNSTVMLPKEVCKVSQTDNTIRLLFICILLLKLDV